MISPLVASFFRDEKKKEKKENANHQSQPARPPLAMQKQAHLERLGKNTPSCTQNGASFSYPVTVAGPLPRPIPSRVWFYFLHVLRSEELAASLRHGGGLPLPLHLLVVQSLAVRLCDSGFPGRTGATAAASASTGCRWCCCRVVFCGQLGVCDTRRCCTTCAATATASSLARGCGAA